MVINGNSVWVLTLRPRDPMVYGLKVFVVVVGKLVIQRERDSLDKNIRDPYERFLPSDKDKIC